MFSKAFKIAFKFWSKMTELNFIEISPNNLNLIDIKIEFGSRNHGDPWPFDGKGLFIIIKNNFI